MGIDEKPGWNLLSQSNTYKNFGFIKINLEDKENLPKLFKEQQFEIVCNLAAQAGVRYSLENPMAYVDSNIVSFVNLLECIRNFKVRKLVYASSSSVYGLNEKVPFSVTDNVDHPISFYAATKKSNELMAYTYSHLFKIETIGLRFFTVYGPWGRPDMAMFLFTDAILNDKPIKVFNNGNLSRDFTYIDDIVEGLAATMLHERDKKYIDDIVEGLAATMLHERDKKSMYSLYNIGNSKPVKLLDFISEIEKCTGLVATKEMMPMQPGDVEQTWADVQTLEEDFGYKPETSIERGVGEFVEWYKMYFKVE